MSIRSDVRLSGSTFTFDENFESPPAFETVETTLPSLVNIGTPYRTVVPAGVDVTATLTSPLPSDLTGDGFVDFDDLTILLAHWDEMVAAGQGNLIDPIGTPINFQDLTFLLADWTGPGPVAAPDAAVGEEAVPEPSGWALAVMAALGMSFCRRRRRRSFHNHPEPTFLTTPEQQKRPPRGRRRRYAAPRRGLHRIRV